MRTQPKGYLLSGAALAAAVLLRWLLDRPLGNSLPLVTLFGAVAVAAWVAGPRAAIPVTVVGYLACEVLFISPRGQVGPFDLGTVVGFIAYLVTCAIIIAIGAAARTARDRTRQGRELLRVTLASIGDAVITTDLQGAVTYLNAVAEALTGWSNAEAAGQPLETVFRIVNETTRKPVESPVARALREGVVVGLANHTILIRRNGGECPIDDSAAPIRDEHGTMSGCVLIFRDVSLQRRVAQENAGQLAAARLLAAIVESSDDAIISKSLDGIIQSWNVGAERVFGHTAAEAVGRHISLVIPPERIAEEDKIIASLKAGQRVHHFETERVHRDGQRIQVSLTISPIKDDTGTVVGASKIARDITSQRRAEADREKFVTLIETSTDFIGISDLHGIPLFVNRAGLRMVGLDDLEAAQKVSLASFFFPEDQQRVVGEMLPRVLKEGHGELEVRFRNFKTGDARWMAYKVVTLPGPDGSPAAFATVSQDITERKRLEDDLRRVAADLSEGDRRKDEFLATLAHELRNPLAVVSNAVGAAHKAGGDPRTLTTTLQMLDRQVRQMSRLVDDLLDLSRVTRGKIELRKERVEVGPIIEQAVEATRSQYGPLSQHLTVNLPTAPVHVVADPARLAQVTANLLNNACKFTDAGGTITLTVEPRAEHVSIRVRDTGIGIAAEQIPHLFDMFAQVDTSIERTRDGLGIGLTLVKTLVEMHGGTVEARSAGLGQGSEFEVRLPLPAEGEATARPSKTELASPHKARRILIVDDNRDGADSLSLLLQLAGHETELQYDGPEGLEAAERWRPDVILLDIGLPGLNGYEVCRSIRQQPWGKEMVLVALSGWGQAEDRRRSQEAGFNVHLVKPVDHDVLVDLLDRLPAPGAAA